MATPHDPFEPRPAPEGSGEESSVSDEVKLLRKRIEDVEKGRDAGVAGNKQGLLDELNKRLKAQEEKEAARKALDQELSAKYPNLTQEEREYAKAGGARGRDQEEALLTVMSSKGPRPGGDKAPTTTHVQEDAGLKDATTSLITKVIAPPITRQASSQLGDNEATSTDNLQDSPPVPIHRKNARTVDLDSTDPLSARAADFQRTVAPGPQAQGRPSVVETTTTTPFSEAVRPVAQGATAPNNLVSGVNLSPPSPDSPEPARRPVARAVETVGSDEDVGLSVERSRTTPTTPHAVDATPTHNPTAAQLGMPEARPAKTPVAKAAEVIESRAATPHQSIDGPTGSQRLPNTQETNYRADSSGQPQAKQAEQTGQAGQQSGADQHSLETLIEALIAKKVRVGLSASGPKVPATRELLKSLGEGPVRDLAREKGLTGDSGEKGGGGGEGTGDNPDSDPLLKKLENLRKGAKKQRQSLAEMIQSIEEELKGHSKEQVAEAKTAYGLDEDATDKHFATSIIAGAFRRPVHVRQAARALEEEKQQSDFTQDTRAYERERDRRGKQEEKEEKADRVAGELSPMGGSGKNLADFGRNVFGIGRKLRNRLRGPLGPAPNPENYTRQGKRKPSAPPPPDKLTKAVRAAGKLGQKTASSVGNALGKADKKVGSPIGRLLRGAGKVGKRATAPVGRALAKFGKKTGAPGGGIFGKLAGLFGRGGAPAGAAAAGAGGAGVGAGAVAAGAAGGGGGAAGGAAAAAAAGGGGGALAGGAAALGPAGIAVAFGAAVMEFGKSVYAFAKGQEEIIREQAKVGGGQALGIAQLDVGRTLRDVSTAQETGGSSLRMTESLNQFEEALRPIEALLQNLSQDVVANLLDVMTSILQAVKPGADVVNSIYQFLKEKFGIKDDERALPIDLLKKISDEQSAKGIPQWPSFNGNR